MRFSDREQYTHLPNEITGAYYKEDNRITPAYWLTGFILFMIFIAILFQLADLIFGAEAVTYWLASLIS